MFGLLVLLLPPVAAVDPPVPSLRFGIGDRVECKVGNDWEPATVMQRYYHEESSTEVVPYQAQLDRGGRVYAPVDDDSVIRSASRPSADPRLRFAVGARVECFLGDSWEGGTVMALNFYRHDGSTQPYHCRLDSGGEVFAPRDDDSVIRSGGAPRSLPGAGRSKLKQGRVGARASGVGSRHAGSKLGGSKASYTKPQRARAHKSARPEPREQMLERWREVSDLQARGD